MMLWQVGDWQTCSASCGNGVKNRTVSCVDDDGVVTNSTKCVGLQPEHEAYCNDTPCDFCSTTDCSSQVCLLPPFDCSTPVRPSIALGVEVEPQHQQSE